MTRRIPGEAQEDVDDAHDRSVDQAAEVTGDAAQRDPDRGGDGDHRHAHGQRYAGAVKQAGQHVAAQPVLAHRVARRRWFQRGRQLLRFGVGGGQKRSEETGRRHDQ